MTWTDFKEYSSDVQLQIGQRIQKLRIDKKIAAVDLAAVLDIWLLWMSSMQILKLSLPFWQKNG